MTMRSGSEAATAERGGACHPGTSPAARPALIPRNSPRVYFGITASRDGLCSWRRHVLRDGRIHRRLARVEQTACPDAADYEDLPKHESAEDCRRRRLPGSRRNGPVDEDARYPHAPE